MNWPELIGGLGLGSLITSVTTYFMTRRATARDRWYQEKREAYLGLLSALHEAAVNPSETKANAYALWQSRCDLFASPDVRLYAQTMTETNDGPREARIEAFNGLIQAMKADLRAS
jgi:hypothetical protein